MPATLLLFKGSFLPAGAPALAPDARGVHVEVTDSAGAVVDVGLPGGVVGASPSTPCDARDGWVRRDGRAGSLFTYRNFSGFLDAACTVGAQDIWHVVVKDRRSARRSRVELLVDGSAGSGAKIVDTGFVRRVYRLR